MFNPYQDPKFARASAITGHVVNGVPAMGNLGIEITKLVLSHKEAKAAKAKMQKEVELLERQVKNQEACLQAKLQVKQEKLALIQDMRIKIQLQNEIMQNAIQSIEALPLRERVLAYGLILGQLNSPAALPFNQPPQFANNSAFFPQAVVIEDNVYRAQAIESRRSAVPALEYKRGPTKK